MATLDEKYEIWKWGAIGMGKGKRLKARQGGTQSFLSHPEEVLTRNFQKEIRNSELGVTGLPLLPERGKT